MKDQTRRGFLTLIGKTAIVAGVVATAPKTAIAKLKESKSPWQPGSDYRWTFPGNARNLPENAMGILRVEPDGLVVERGSILLTL